MIKTIADLQQQIADFNLTRLERNLLSVVRSCVYIERELVENPEDLPIGASRLGGNPDLPEGFEWLHFDNHPLTFIAQFRLSEISAYDVDKIFPSQGLLYFFYDVDSQPWGNYEDRKGWSIIYIEDEQTPLTRTQHPTADGKYTDIKALPLHAVSFIAGLSLPVPQYDDKEFYGIALESGEEDDYFELVDSLAPTQAGIHQILGYPRPIQYYVEWDCVLHSLPDDKQQELRNTLKASADSLTMRYQKMREWQFLFQIDSDDDLNVMWGDVGTLYICISKESLKQKRFEDCWTILQCS